MLTPFDGNILELFILVYLIGKASAFVCSSLGG